MKPEIHLSYRNRLALLMASCICFSLFISAQKQVKVYLIGDSTLYTYKTSEYPMAGWGQVFSLYFRQGTVSVDNRAIGGRSSRMFYTEDRWKTIVNLLQSGDYVFIQFGHNDRDYSKAERYTDTADYKKYLRLFIKETRAKEAIPVLVSPMNMNTWNGTTVREVFCENANDYRGAMIMVATELDVPFIDLEKKSAEYMKLAGQNYCTSFHFLGLQPGEYPNYPDGKADGTHFQEMGALANARMVAEGIGELSDNALMKPLSDLLAPQNTVTIISNKPAAGLITLNGDYPPGATVTLKVMPKAGEIFEKWVDDAGKTVATTARYAFTMSDSPQQFTGIFKGGSTGVYGRPFLKQEHTASSLLDQTVYITTPGMLHITSLTPIDRIQLVTLHGRAIRTIVPLSAPLSVSLPTPDISTGVVLVHVTTAGQTQTVPVSVY